MMALATTLLPDQNNTAPDNSNTDLTRLLKGMTIYYYRATGKDQSMWINSVAMPRKLKKPAMSVTVVKNMDDDWAGS